MSQNLRSEYPLVITGHRESLTRGMARLAYESTFRGRVETSVPIEPGGIVTLPEDAKGPVNISYLPENTPVLSEGGMFGWTNPIERPKHAGITKAKPSKAKAKAKTKMQKASRRKNRK